MTTPPGAQERANEIERFQMLVETDLIHKVHLEGQTLIWPAEVTEAIFTFFDDAIAQAMQAALEEVDEIVGKWEQAYPEDVFRPFKAVDHPHVSPDRIAAEMGRHMARELRKQIAALRARPAEHTETWPRDIEGLGYRSDDR